MVMKSRIQLRVHLKQVRAWYGSSLQSPTFYLLSLHLTLQDPSDCQASNNGLAGVVEVVEGTSELLQGSTALAPVEDRAEVVEDLLLSRTLRSQHLLDFQDLLPQFWPWLNF